MRRTAIALILVIPALSCSRTAETPRPTIAFVDRIISNPSSDLFQRVSSYDPSDNSGPVCIIGDPESCIRMSEMLMTCDMFDNVDGRRIPDGLPDFAGETFLSILDEANAPYAPYLSKGNDEFLRELAVRHVLECLDTVSYVSPYDQEGMGRRVGAKLIISATSFFSASGRFDVDTLFQCAGRISPLISPLDIMFSQVLRKSGAPVSVGVLADSASIAGGVIAKSFDSVRRECSSRASVCTPRIPATSGDVLLDYLDAYEYAGNTKPLAALVVDAAGVDVGALRATLSRIRVELSDEALRYGKMIEPGFEILESAECAAQTCFKLMRERNIFTHNIAFPKASALVSYPAAGLSDSCYSEDGSLAPEFKFGRAAASDIPTYFLLQYSGRYLPSAVMDQLLYNAPKTYNSYVQK